MRRTERIARLGIPLVVTLAAIAQFQENRVAVSRDDYGGGAVAHWRAIPLEVA